MKTAIIILPKICQPINEGMYLSVCVDKVKKDGYTILHSTYWNEYKDIDFKKLISKCSSGIDAFYFFVDYGICDLMIELIKKVKSKRIIKDIRIEVNMSAKSFVPLEFILEDVAVRAKIPVETLKMKTRKREIVEARQIYFKRSKEVTKSSLASIGALVNLDHATVLHGITTVNDVRELTKRYDEYYHESKI